MTSLHYIYQDFGELVSCERNCWLNLTEIKNLLIFRLILSLTPAWNKLNGWYWTKLFWAKTKTKESRRIFSGYFFLFWCVFRLCYRIFWFGFLPFIPTAGPFTWASQGFAFIYMDFTIHIFLMFRLSRLSLSFKEVFGFSLRCRLQPPCESLSLYNTPMSSNKILMWVGGEEGGGVARCDMDYLFKTLHLLKLFSDFV